MSQSHTHWVRRHTHEPPTTPSQTSPRCWIKALNDVDEHPTTTCPTIAFGIIFCCNSRPHQLYGVIRNVSLQYNRWMRLQTLPHRRISLVDAPLRESLLGTTWGYSPSKQAFTRANSTTRSLGDPTTSCGPSRPQRSAGWTVFILKSTIQFELPGCCSTCLIWHFRFSNNMIKWDLPVMYKWF